MYAISDSFVFQYVSIIANRRFPINQNFCGIFTTKNPASQGRVFVVILQQIIAKLG
jgi:hypothetical protein